jgi:hypothetical protein
MENMKNAYPSGYGAALGGAGVLGSAGMIQAARPASLEEKLDYLQRGVERISQLRNALECLADQICVDVSPCASGSASAPAQDLLSRYGETIQYLHNQADSMEHMVRRIRNSLFDEKRNTEQAKLDQVQRAR